MQGTTNNPSSLEPAVDPRAVKARLFGDESSDRLHKQVIKARFLRNLQQPTGGLETRESDENATVPGTSPGEPPQDPVRIGRYAVLRKLGQGGMGVVYVAYDEDLDRKVAIKLLRRELLKDDRGRARMLREAQALARLSHPNVVQVHEVSRWQDHDYVAMEYVDGQTLDRWLGDERRRWQQILEVMCEAGRGLEAAHAAGLIHRDFKPANLMVARDGRARVLDFGLARSTNERETPARGTPIVNLVETAEQTANDISGNDETAACSVFDKMLTATGALLGTPAYMAPEQHLGRPATVLSDQFSFCVVLYEALYGRRPFKGGSRAEYAVHVTEGLIQPPPSNSGVPAWLRKAVVRGLAANPDERWPSMSDLLAELRRDRTRSWRGAAIASGLLTVFGLALLAGGGEDRAPLCELDPASIADTWGDEQREAVRVAFGESGVAEADAVLDHARRGLDRYAEQIVAARAEACEARWVAHSQTDAQLELRAACLDQRERELAAVVGVLVDADRDVVLHAPELLAGLGDVGLCARVDLLEAGTPAPKDAAAVAQIAGVREMIARAHAAREVGRIAEAKQLTEAAWDEAERLEFEPLLGELRILKARNLRFERDYAGARSELIDAAAILQRHQQLDTLADAWLELATIAAWQAEDATLELQLATATVDQYGNRPRHRALLGYARGLARLKAGQAKAAVTEFDDALKWCSQFVGSDHLVSTLLATRANALVSMGENGKARADLERVISTRGAWSRPQLDALFDLALARIEAGEVEQGELDMRTALGKYRELFGPDYESIGHGELALFRLAMQRGEFEAAEQSIENALRILGHEHPDHGYALDALASLQLDRREFAAAEATLRRAIQQRARAIDDPARNAYLQRRLATVYQVAGRFDQAVAAYDEAIASLGQPGLDAPFDLAEALLGRGEVYLQQDQAQLALESLERAVRLVPLDSGVVWLAGESRVRLAEALARLDIRHEERRELARAAARLLAGVPGSEDVLALARELSDAESPSKPIPR